MSRGNLPYVDLEPREFAHSNGEVSLCRAVILRALMDACGQAADLEGNQKIIEQERARIWLRGTQQDYFRVCSWAEIDPAALRERAAYLIALSDIGECPKFYSPEKQPRSFGERA